MFEVERKILLGAMAATAVFGAGLGDLSPGRRRVRRRPPSLPIPAALQAAAMTRQPHHHAHHHHPTSPRGIGRVRTL
jgi:hypothetical protein